MSLQCLSLTVMIHGNAVILTSSPNCDCVFESPVDCFRSKYSNFICSRIYSSRSESNPRRLLFNENQDQFSTIAEPAQQTLFMSNVKEISIDFAFPGNLTKQTGKVASILAHMYSFYEMAVIECQILNNPFARPYRIFRSKGITISIYRFFIVL